MYVQITVIPLISYTYVGQMVGST